MAGSSSSAAKDVLKEWAALTTDGMLAETSGKVPFLKTILKDWKVPINFGNAEEEDSANEKQKCVRIIVRFPASLLSEDTKTNASEKNTSESCCLSVDFNDVDIRTLAPPEVPILIQFHGDDSIPLETNHVLLQEVVDLVKNAPEGVSKDVIVVNVDYRLASEEEQRYRSFPIPQGILDALSVMEYLLGGNNNENSNEEEEKDDAQQPSYRTNIHVTGHSDGANLAMVAGFEAARRYPGSIASVQTQSPTVDPATFDPTYLDLSKIVPNIGLLRWCWKSYLGLAKKLKTTRRINSNQNDNENEKYKEENIDKNNKSQTSTIDSDKNTPKHDDNDYNTIESEYYTMESSDRNDFTMEGSDRNEDDATEDARVSDQDDDDDDNDKDYNTFESDIITNDHQEDDGGNDFNTIESAYYTMQSSDRIDLTMEGSDGIEEDSSIHARGGGSDKDDDDNDYNTIESVFNTLDSGDIESSEYTTLHSGETNDKDSSEHARVSDHDDDSTGNDPNTIDSGDTSDDNEYNTIDSSSKTDNGDSDDTNDTDAMANALDSIRYNENDHSTSDSSSKNKNFKSDDTNYIDAKEEALGSIRYDDNTTSDSSSKNDNVKRDGTNDIDAMEDAFGSIRYDDNTTSDSSSKSDNDDSGDINDMGAIEEAFGSIRYDDNNDHSTSDSNSKSDNDEPTERPRGSSHSSIL